MCSQTGTVEEHHAELKAALLNEADVPFPDTIALPPDEDLSGTSPGFAFRLHGELFGSVLMPPDDGRDGQWGVHPV